MKKSVMLLTAFLLVTAIAVTAGAEEEKWFDLENCIFCKNLLDDPELMNHLTWEIHEISDGIMIVTTIDPEYRESYNKAEKAIEQVASEMMQGKHMDEPVCGYCHNYGALMFKGAKIERIPAETAEIVLIRSDKEELQKEIKAFGERTNEELAKFEAEDK